MNTTHVLGASALIALFRGYPPVFRLFQEADTGRIEMVLPACAVGEANGYLRASESAWEGLLLSRVTVMELSASGAITAGLLTTHLATGHVVHEARATRGVVVTQEPGRYSEWVVPLLVL